MTITIPDTGLRLADANSIITAINNLNQSSRKAALVATGTTQATALQLTSVINIVGTTASGTGVNLPSSSGNASTPFAICVVVNAGANTLKVYGAQVTTETINGTAGATGVSQTTVQTALYVSGVAGAWFRLLSA